MIIKEILRLKATSPLIFWGGIGGFSYFVCKCISLIFW